VEFELERKILDRGFLVRCCRELKGATDASFEEACGRYEMTKTMYYDKKIRLSRRSFKRDAVRATCFSTKIYGAEAMSYRLLM
jgi:hypothetical protein